MEKNIVLGGSASNGASAFADLTDKTTADLPTINTPLATALAGKVAGAASSTDNAIARFDGATGKIVQNSVISISDSGEVTKTSGIGGAAGIEFVTNTVYGGILSLKPAPELGESSSAIWLFTNYINGSGKFLALGAGFDGHIPGTFGFGSIVFGNQAAACNDFSFVLGSTSGRIERVRIKADTGFFGININNPTAQLDVNGTSRFRSSATFNGQIIDNAGSSGVDGQVLKKVGGLVVWSNP